MLIVVDTGPDKKPHFEFTPKSKWVERLRSGGDKYKSVEIDDLHVIVNRRDGHRSLLAEGQTGGERQQQ